MADSGGSLQTQSTHSGGANEGEDDGNAPNIEEIMERLRSRLAHQKTWLDATKALRISNTEKKPPIDLSDKPFLQKHLEKLQKALKVTTLNWMIERLEAAARQCSLKFNNHGSTEIHISSDMFFIQVMLEVSGKVKDVRLTHSGDSQFESCPNLTASLNNGQFSEFQANLQGLGSMYQVGAVDKKQKTKMYIALQAVEKDLNALSQMQKKISGVSNYVHKTPLGILLPRRAGQPMKLTYYVAPYDLLNKKRMSTHDMTIEEITKNELGYSVSVAIESSTPHKLQTIPLMNIKTQDGKSLPSISGLNHVNSTSLPATFVLRLQKPISLSMSVLRKIQATTGIEFVQASQARPLLSLLIQQTTKGRLDPSTGSSPLYVSLPDQNHGYFVGGLNGTADLMGVTVSKIPFSHPTHVPAIIQQLRQQICFNTIITSCIRTQHKSSDLHRCLTFEVTPVSLQHLTVNFEHPLRDSIATVELDMTDVTNVRCRMYTSDDESFSLCTDDQISKLMHRSMSLPITMRAVLKKATPDLELQIEKLAVVPPPPVLTPMSRLGLERRQAFIDAHHHVGGVPPPLDRQLSLQSLPGSYNASTSVSSVVLAASMDGYTPPGYTNGSPPGGDPDHSQQQHRLTPDKASKNPMLASLLDQSANSPETQQPSMLSQLLNNDPHGNSAAGGQLKPRKPRKRKTDVKSPGGAVGRSPKRKPSEDDFGAGRGEFSSLDMDMNNMYEMSTVLSQEQQQHHQRTQPQQQLQQPHHQQQQQPQQGMYGNNNLQESRGGAGGGGGGVASHVTRLASSVDNIIKHESKNFSGISPQQQQQQQQSSIDMLQPSLHPPLLLANEIKQEQLNLEKSMDYAQHSAGVKREGSASYMMATQALGGATTGVLSKGNSLADLLKTDSPIPEVDAMVPTAGSGKRELNTLAPAALSERSVGFGAKSHKSFDTALTNSSSTKSQQNFNRSNSIEILDSPPAKIKPEVGKSVNMMITKNSIGNRDKPNYKLDASNLKYEDKQGSSSNVSRDKVKKDKKEEDVVAPRLTLKFPRELINKKEQTGSAETSPRQDPFEYARSITPKDPKDRLKFSGKEHIYELGSDSEDTGPLPSLGFPRTTALASAESNKPSSPSGKIRKIKSEDSMRGEKKRRTDGEYSRKKKREGSEGKKDKGKRKRIYDIDAEFGGSGEGAKSSGSSHLSGIPMENKLSTKIRISTVAGKLQITPKPNNSPSSSTQMKSSPKTSLTSPNALGSKSLKSSTSTSKLGRPPGSSKQFSRSRSDPHGIGANKVDSKLTTKTPTIKLKPLVMPSSTTTVTVNTSSSKMSQGASGGPGGSGGGGNTAGGGGGSGNNATSNQSGSKSASIEKSMGKTGPKLPLQKQRKASLSAVVDSLTRKQLLPSGQSSLSQKIEKIEKRATGKSDALSTKNKLDAIRKEILMAGHGPAKDLISFKSSQRKPDQSKLSLESGFTRLEKSGKLDPRTGTPPASLPPTPIPKISKTLGSSPVDPPSTPIPKISSSGSKTAPNSSATNKFNATSGSVLSRSASNVSSSSSGSGAQSTEVNKNNITSAKESSYSSKGPSGSLGGTETNKSKVGVSPMVGGAASNSNSSSSSNNSSSSGSTVSGTGGSSSNSNQSTHTPPSILRKSSEQMSSRYTENARDNHSPNMGSHNNANANAIGSQNVHNNKDLAGGNSAANTTDDGSKRLKLDDSGDRLQGRHFLDALGAASGHGPKGENASSGGSGGGGNNNPAKAGTKRPAPPGGAGGDGSKSDQYQYHGNNSVDKSRVNGLNNRLGNNSTSCTDNPSRSSPKESAVSGNRTERPTKDNSSKSSTEHSISSSSAHTPSDRNIKSVAINNKQINNLDVQIRSTTKQPSQHATLQSSSSGTGNSLGSAPPKLPSGRGSHVYSSVSHAQSSTKLTNSHTDSLLTSSSTSSTTISSSSSSSTFTHHDSSLQNASVPTKQDKVVVGAFDNKENTDIASPDPEDSVFKAPTPKIVRRDDLDSQVESRGSSRLDRIRPIRSPCSDPGSPDDSLVIDCPGALGGSGGSSVGGGSNRSATRSPVCRSTDHSPVAMMMSRSPVCTAGPPTGGGGGSGTDMRSKSPAATTVTTTAGGGGTNALNKLPPPPRSPSPRRPILTSKLPPPASPSPPRSPVLKHNTLSVRRESPVEIDDDLMDQALMM